jgi:hypothetical protein
LKLKLKGRKEEIMSIRKIRRNIRRERRGRRMVMVMVVVMGLRVILNKW